MSMKVAILGRGKTGGQMIQLCRQENLPHTVFSTENPPHPHSLQGHEVAIAFIPFEAFLQVAPHLLEADLPVVSGCTGGEFPPSMIADLKEKKLAWIQGNNFSLGMNLIQRMIETLSLASRLFPAYLFDIEETHHQGKRDAPSGTALKWNEWLNIPCKIHSHREGDVVGEHQLTLKTPTEEITLRHKALHRQIFAQGALWAAHYLLSHSLTPGLHPFEQLVQKELL